jgi:hypothetical protein
MMKKRRRRDGFSTACQITQPSTDTVRKITSEFGCTAAPTAVSGARRYAECRTAEDRRADCSFITHE